MVDVIVFDGRQFAKEKEKDLRFKIYDLRKKGITPKLVSILVGDDPASKLYTSLKKKAAERMGIEMEVRKFSESESVNQLIQLISKLNKDNSVHGIMVQLPLPKAILNSQFSILNSIDPKKDVDGLREDSKFIPATVKAALQIIEEAELRIKNYELRKIVVVGSEGNIGKRLVKELRAKGLRVIGVDLNTKYNIQNTKQADILISATGVPNIIKGDMVKKGAVVIDVGSPKGDVQFDEVIKKAAFITPVPGGIGPVTIACLLENLSLFYFSSRSA